MTMTKKTNRNRKRWLLIEFVVELLALFLDANLIIVLNLCVLIWRWLREEEEEE
ncbi:hypothetical protein LYNGBM3L_36370 [Moorena producens 3L]|uniref:Uncharacterized protein n=2 Tax=Moorena TaxID=1155738 RepID=F4XUX5_9CYAN|nr:hypothetical protein LYNGBM3L_36370 [Moorena producens 3L]